MCTLVMDFRRETDWPILIGTNRDEMADRSWLPPGRHWPDRPDVIAGLDQQAGGSWLGMNDAGVVAAVNNRIGSLGPENGKRSRGELVLEALDHYTAADAAEALADLNPAAYRAFNLMVADVKNAFWIRNLGTNNKDSIEIFTIPQGISILTAFDLNDSRCLRTQTYLPLFKAAKAPQPDKDDWTEWETLFLSREPASKADTGSAMRLITESGFNTISSSLIALPAARLGLKPVWRFAGRFPQSEPYQKIPLNGG